MNGGFSPLNELFIHASLTYDAFVHYLGRGPLESLQESRKIQGEGRLHTSGREF